MNRSMQECEGRPIPFNRGLLSCCTIQVGTIFSYFRAQCLSVLWMWTYVFSALKAFLNYIFPQYHDFSFNYHNLSRFNQATIAVPCTWTSLKLSPVFLTELSTAYVGTCTIVYRPFKKVYSFSQSLWLISQIRIEILKTTCSIFTSVCHLCTWKKQFLIYLNTLQMLWYIHAHDYVQFSALSYIINCL